MSRAHRDRWFWRKAVRGVAPDVVLRFVSAAAAATAVTVAGAAGRAAACAQDQEPPPPAPPASASSASSTAGRVAAAAQADATPRLVVTVNGQPVNFMGREPAEQSGHLLVPLRGVLEQLGASLSYDRSSQTVFAVRGDTRVALTIGQRVATVNGHPLPLDVPAQERNGVTMVPLRFMAEAFGAHVSYDAPTNTVAIAAAPVVSPDDAAAAAQKAAQPEMPAAAPGADATAATPPRTAGALPSGETTIVGDVEAVYSDPAPSRLVVRIAPDGGVAGVAGGSEHTVVLRSDAALTSERPDGPAEQIGLGAIEVGDRVAIRRARDRAAEAVNLLSSPARPAWPRPTPITAGVVFKAEFLRWEKLPGDRIMLEMQDGRTVEVPQTTPILLGGREIAAALLRSGDNLKIDVDPTTHLATRVLVTFRP